MRQTIPLQIIVNCAREIDASIAHYCRLRPPDSCVHHIDASIQFSFWKKNRAQLSAFLLQITADCAQRTDTFSISIIINIDKRNE